MEKMEHISLSFIAIILNGMDFKFFLFFFLSLHFFSK